jgi:hypothetical protein
MTNNKFSMTFSQFSPAALVAACRAASQAATITHFLEDSPTDGYYAY